VKKFVTVLTDILHWTGPYGKIPLAGFENIKPSKILKLNSFYNKYRLHLTNLDDDNI
jgi:hypothetical protein